MNILVFAPHADDEIIGVGGIIAKRIAQGNNVFICIVTRGTEPLFLSEQIEKIRNEAQDCHALLGIKKTFFLDFPSVMLEREDRSEINEKILDVVNEVRPDEVYIPHWGDMQKDHQIVHEACMVALRPKYDFIPKQIYAYETLSETGWNTPNVQNDFVPNVYEDISDFLSIKIEAMEKYQSQLTEFPAARSIEAIEALAKYRGAISNRKAAEAFVLIREIR